MVDRRKTNFFEGIFGPNSFENTEEIFEHLSRSLGISLENFENQPFVYGFSVTPRPGTAPEVREFGNLPALESAEGKVCYPGIRKPLIDVLETEDRVHVIAEMPGIEKENIQLNATDLILELETLKGNPKYSERVELPIKVDPQSAKATYKNGVLEVIFKRLGSNSRTSIDIK
ncbi:MAG: Hsp20/alpha crystallin family protein [Methanosarcinaceae archaeon]|nr:Hsp20/alpha crystallin family protein [Methanosarcinaceae archaeon]MDD4497119.1 Hsp20/alpha crystallin family protein [Methanosarcinaceae archaeon]